MASDAASRHRPRDARDPHRYIGGYDQTCAAYHSKIDHRLACHRRGSSGHLIDDGRWSDFEVVFNDDFVWDSTAFGHAVVSGLDPFRQWFSTMGDHPVAHHATNVVVMEEDDGTVRVHSKGIGVGHRGRVGSVTYRDRVVRTPAGWRLAERVAVPRRPMGERA
jgi:hypothetical protein